MLHAQIGKFNIQQNNFDYGQNPKHLDKISTPFVLKVKNRDAFDTSRNDEFDLKIPPISLHHTDQITYQIYQKQKEIENKSLKQQNDYLARELELKQKEIEALLSICSTARPQQKRHNYNDSELYDHYSVPVYQNQNYSYQGNIETKRAYSHELQDSYRVNSSSDQNSYNSYTRIKRIKNKSQVPNREYKEVRFSEDDSSVEKLPSIRRTSSPSSNQFSHQLGVRRKVRKQFIYFSRLKIIFLLVQAAIRWSKNFRQKRKLKIQLLKKLQSKYDSCVEQIAQQDVTLCKAVIKKWVQQMIDPIIQVFSSTQFIQEGEQHQKDPNSDQSIKMRQSFFLQISKQLLSDMEFYTQKGKIPNLIQTSLYLSLFKSQNSTAPLFVAKRTNYYTRNTIKIGNYQEKMILSEYFIFRLFAYHLIEQTNNHNYQNLNHKMQSKFLLIAILGILQILFIDYFGELKQLKDITTELFQRRIKVNKSQDIQIITDKNIDREESLIFGLHNRDNFEELFNNNENWLKDICTKFGKIVNNLHTLIG